MKFINKDYNTINTKNNRAIKLLLDCDQMNMSHNNKYNVDLLILIPVNKGHLPDNEYYPGLLYDLSRAKYKLSYFHNSFLYFKPLMKLVGCNIIINHQVQG